jgi:hypothetical protein
MIASKKYMESLGPGSYNTNQSTQIIPVHKANKEASHTKLKELI